MRVLAPAKINLFLRVGRVRADGFHPLRSWMCTCSLFDTLTFVRHREGGGGKWFTLSCDHPDLRDSSRNLVMKVAETLADTLSRVGEGSTGLRERVSAILIKRIPLGAGLGGGSSDAAACIRALNEMLGAALPLERQREIAAKIGSDVPFFVTGASAICEGRGEIVTPIAVPAAREAVIVVPGYSISTADVYRRFDVKGLGNELASEDGRDWEKLATAELLPKLVNDLEPAAFSLRPELGELRKEMTSEIGRIVRMSGSGSALFTLFDDAAEAKEAAERVASRFKVQAMAVRLAPELDMSLQSGAS